MTLTLKIFIWRDEFVVYVCVSSANALHCGIDLAWIVVHSAAHKQVKTTENTQEVKMNAIEYGLDKTMCSFSAYFDFDKATNGRTDVKHEMW